MVGEGLSHGWRRAMTQQEAERQLKFLPGHKVARWGSGENDYLIIPDYWNWPKVGDADD